MDHDHWGTLAIFIIVIVMMAPSTISKARRKMQAPTQTDHFFDSITEFQNDFA